MRKTMYQIFTKGIIHHVACWILEYKLSPSEYTQPIIFEVRPCQVGSQL